MQSQTGPVSRLSCESCYEQDSSESFNVVSPAAVPASDRRPLILHPPGVAPGHTALFPCSGAAGSAGTA